MTTQERIEQTEKIKQAKIDVLNELKDMLDSKPEGWSYTIYINEIIKDIENGIEDEHSSN